MSVRKRFCVLRCGDWRCGKGGLWDFSVDTDKLQFSRIISVEPEMSLTKLKEAVGNEFQVSDVSRSSMVLSYLPSNVDGAATSKHFPPIMLSNDASVNYFLYELEAGNTKNLYVSLASQTKRKVHILEEENGSCYATPVGKAKKVVSFCDDGASHSAGEFGVATPRFDSAVCSKTTPIIHLEDELLAVLEEEERVFKTKSTPSVPVSDSTKSDFDLGIDEEALSDDDVGADEDVSPFGFDREFWDPLLAEDLGGSNAVEIMYPDEDNVDKSILSPDKWTEIRGQEHVDVDRVTSQPEPTVTEPTPNTPDSVSTRRKLSEIDDEEFDIPPMFDDMEYVCADVPDLEKVGGDEGFYVGRLFGCREDLQIALAIYAIKNMFHFTQARTLKNYVLFECTDKQCDWRVNARELKDCGYLRIRKAHLEHTCSLEIRNRFREKATSRVIAAVYKAKYGDPQSGPLAMQLQQMVLEDLRVPTSYMKCYRAKDKAQVDLWGTDDDSYLKLPSYLYRLQLANPGTVTDLKTEVLDDGVERFKYLFLAFGASIEGFKMLRRVIVVDGTHLFGQYKGVLLTASGQDANFQVFPLAYAVVDAENDASWTWFFHRLEAIIPDSVDLSIISDRCNSIYKAKSTVYPLAHHAACIVHLQRNVTSQFKSRGLAKIVGKAAFAFKVGEFNELFKQVRRANADCAKYLEKIGLSHWARSCFRGERYNLMTSNVAEQLNKALKKGRKSPIIELLRFIQSMMTRWFSARRKKSSKHRGQISLEVEKAMTKNKKKFVGSNVNRVSAWSCEVVGLLGERAHVFLDSMQCSCRSYDKLKIPCGHAMLAADFIGVSYPRILPTVFKSTAWVTTYQGIINPELDEQNVVLPEDVTKKLVRPPKTRIPSGRRKTTRIPSQGEYPVSKTNTKPSINRCGRCRGVGHNRASCKNPI